nr:MAG TPA: hypothetical protein [Caudoviricetes sp.]
MYSKPPYTKQSNDCAVSIFLHFLVELHNCDVAISCIVPERFFLTFLSSANIIELSEHRNAR